MDMSADSASIAARRVEMETIKPVTQKPRVVGDHRFTQGANARERRKHNKDSSNDSKNSHYDTKRYGSAGLPEGEDASPSSPGETEGGEHLLDVRV